jgi:DNA primase
MSKDMGFVVYQDIKKRVTMEMVLRRYGLWDQMKLSGKNLVSTCPIHNGTNPRQFSVNLERNLWNCFGNCQGGGNVLDFVAKMEGITIREAALHLQAWFKTEGQEPARRAGEGEKETGKANGQAGAEKSIQGHSAQPKILANPPLTFELKNLASEHPWFEEKGIKLDTRTFFGLGVAGKGMMLGRVVIPIHNHAGELVAYCGRAINAEDEAAEGKYKLPANFHKGLVVYNLHRQKREEDAPLVIVESFLSVWKLHQAGWPRVVALMGSQLSAAQEEAITTFLGPDGMALLMFDADEAGEKCTASAQGRLGRKVWVRVPDFSQFGKKKPHHLTDEEIKVMLG